MVTTKNLVIYKESTFPGRYNNIDEELMEKIDEELNKNGYIHNPTVE